MRSSASYDRLALGFETMVNRCPDVSFLWFHSFVSVNKRALKALNERTKLSFANLYEIATTLKFTRFLYTNTTSDRTLILEETLRNKMLSEQMLLASENWETCSL